MNKNYYKNLISLFEATAQDKQGQNPNAEEEVPQEEQQPEQQSQMPENQEQHPQEANVEAQDGTDGLDDANYMQQEQGVEQPAEPMPNSSVNPQKLVRLFNLFKNLMNYSDSFEDCLSSIDIDNIDENNFDLYSNLQKDLVSLVEKVKTYLKFNFSNESYEKNLYSYILFRTELLTIIKQLRIILKLDETDTSEGTKF